MKTLSVVTNTSIPHHSAESIHMTLMCDQLARICKMELISSAKIWRPNTFSKDLEKYGLGDSPIIHKKRLQFYPNDFTLFKWSKRWFENRVFYCRQTAFASYFINKGSSAVLELHTMPSSWELEFLKLNSENPLFIGLIVITQSLKQDIVNSIGDTLNSKIHVLPDAANISQFQFAENNLSKPLKAGYIGSNFPGKGFEIIQKLIEDSNIEIELYGFDSIGHTRDTVVFHGKVPYSHVPAAMNSFDIGLLPNQLTVILPNGNDIGKYTSPMKMFEYMAAGKVIVASDIPVIREVLTHNYNAILVPHDNVEKWKEAIENLMNNLNLAETLRNQAYKDVCEKYSYQARAEKLLKIIYEALGK
jgi:glycosyltransferase involved in cell wall biosynthesis